MGRELRRRSYEVDRKTGLVEPEYVNIYEIAARAELAPILEGKPDITRPTEIDLQELDKRFRTQQQTKREFLGEWVRAVNGHGGFGKWSADVARHPPRHPRNLARHNNS